MRAGPDALPEEDETLIVAITPSESCEIDPDAPGATITIVDNDQWRVDDSALEEESRLAEHGKPRGGDLRLMI